MTASRSRSTCLRCCAFFAGAGVCVASLVLVGCGQGDTQIQVYTAPKPLSPVSNPAASHDHDHDEQAAPALAWDVPQGWQQAAGNSAMRLATIKKSEAPNAPAITIARFPGQIGSDTMNVNRWRRQLKLPAVADAAAAKAISPLNNTQVPGRLVDIHSDTKRTLVAWFKVDGENWFFKLSGKSDAVDTEKPAFTKLLGSIHQTRGASGDGEVITAPPSAMSPTATPEDQPVSAPAGAPDAASTSGSSSPPSATPHAPLPPPAGRFTAGDITGPIPQGWEADPEPQSPRLATLRLKADPKKATITVTRFPGEVGGNLANVNRWRDQVGQDPIKDLSQQDSFKLPVDGRASTVYQVVPRPAKANSPRLIVAVVPDGERTWFIKMQGPTARLDPQVQAFVQLITGLHLPPPPEATPEATPEAASQTSPEAGDLRPATTPPNPSS